MDKELYFDIVSDEWSAGLYRIRTANGNTSFYYHHSLSDLEDEDRNTRAVSERFYGSFAEFWKEFKTSHQWFILHPLYIHPEQRSFIKDALKKVNWNLVEDEKWQEMYQRQWSKVLNDPPTYYKPMKP